MNLRSSWLGIGLMACMVPGLLPAADTVAEPIVWRTWSGEVLREARQKQRLILLDVTADWCRYCRKMKATTWRDPQVQAVIARHYIAVRADEARDPEVVARFPDVGRPGTVILNGQGYEILHKSGYVKPQWMVWLLQAVVQNPDPNAHEAPR